MAASIRTRVEAVGLEQSMEEAYNRGQRRINRRPLRVKADTRGFEQPLGRITGQMSEFQKSMDASVARVFAFGAAVAVINGVQRALGGMVTEALRVEKALMDVNVLLELSQGKIKDFGNEMFTVARNTVQSFNTISEAATEFARQGLGAEETLRRVNDAMILTRLSGLDAANSVSSLTAAVNTFKKEALDTTQVVNRLANVDASFAVSSKDLADALSRAGASANSAKVDFNELLAVTAAVQERTARGGAVIGNAFKTIFTRLQRSRVRDVLEEIGVATEDTNGQLRSATQILIEYGRVYQTLSDQQKAYTAEQVAGVRQIGILKAFISDLGDEYGAYNRALRIANGTTNQATRRNAELNQTVSALATQTSLSVQKLAAALGQLTMSDGIKRLLSGVESFANMLSSVLDPESGSSMIKGFFKGIGNFLSGPGLVLVGAAFAKITMTVGKLFTQAFAQIFNVNKETQRRRNLEEAILIVLQKEEGLLRQMQSTQSSSIVKEQAMLEVIRRETAERVKQQALLRTISGMPSLRPYSAGPQGFQRRAEGAIPTKAGGAIPVHPGHPAAIQEKAKAAQVGYSAGSVMALQTSTGPVVYNRKEQVRYLGGYKDPWISPPKNSLAGTKHRAESIRKTGIDPYGMMASLGFIPNLASPKGTKWVDRDKKNDALQWMKSWFMQTGFVASPTQLRDKYGFNNTTQKAVRTQFYTDSLPEKGPQGQSLWPKVGMAGRLKSLGIERPTGRGGYNMPGPQRTNLKKLIRGSLDDLYPQGGKHGKVFWKDSDLVPKILGYPEQGGQRWYNVPHKGNPRFKSGTRMDTINASGPSNAISLLRGELPRKYNMRGVNQANIAKGAALEQAIYTHFDLPDPGNAPLDLPYGSLSGVDAATKDVLGVNKRTSWGEIKLSNNYEHRKHLVSKYLRRQKGGKTIRLAKLVKQDPRKKAGKVFAPRTWKAAKHSTSLFKPRGFAMLFKTDGREDEVGKTTSHTLHSLLSKNKELEDWITYPPGTTPKDRVRMRQQVGSQLKFGVQYIADRVDTGKTKAAQAAAGFIPNFAAKAPMNYGALRTLAQSGSASSLPAQLSKSVRLGTITEAQSQELSGLTRTATGGVAKSVTERQKKRQERKDSVPLLDAKRAVTMLVPERSPPSIGRSHLAGPNVKVEFGMAGINAQDPPNILAHTEKRMKIMAGALASQVYPPAGRTGTPGALTGSADATAGIIWETAAKHATKTGISSSDNKRFDVGLKGPWASAAPTPDLYSMFKGYNTVWADMKLNSGQQSEMANKIYSAFEAKQGPGPGLKLSTKTGKGSRRAAQGMVPNFFPTSLGRPPRKMPVPRFLEQMARRIRRAGGDMQVVGGAPRDHLLGVKPKDWDVEVSGIPSPKLQKILSQHGGLTKEGLIGKSFGVFKTKHGGEEYEFSLPRREVRTGPGHKDFDVKVDPFMSRKEAAQRRDLTVNAIGYDPLSKQFIDPLGGMRDLQAGVMRPTSSRFKEDPLRVLRAMQFAGRYGFSADKRLLEYSRSMSKEFSSLPKERVRDEWFKWASKSAHPEKGLEFLKQSGWIKHFPEIDKLRGIPQNPKFHPEGDVFEHTKLVTQSMARNPDWQKLDDKARSKLMFTALSHDFGKVTHTQVTPAGITSRGHAEAGVAPMRTFLGRIMADGEAAKLAGQMAPLVKNHMFHAGWPQNITDRSVRRLSAQVGGMDEFMILQKADLGGRGETAYRRPYGEDIKKVEKIVSQQGLKKAAPKPVVLGRHLLEKNLLDSGPQMGRVLKELEAAQLDGKFRTVQGGLDYFTNNRQRLLSGTAADGMVPNFANLQNIRNLEARGATPGERSAARAARMRIEAKRLPNAIRRAYTVQSGKEISPELLGSFIKQFQTGKGVSAFNFKDPNSLTSDIRRSDILRELNAGSSSAPVDTGLMARWKRDKEARRASEEPGETRFFGGGLVPNFGINYGPGRGYLGGERMGRARKLTDTESGSIMELEGMGRVKDIVWAQRDGAYKKGGQHRIWKHLAQSAFMRRGGVVRSDTISQQRSFKQGSNTNFEDLVYAFPQLKSRMTQGLTTEGSIISFKDPDFKMSFRNMEDLRSQMNSIPRNEMRNAIGDNEMLFQRLQTYRTQSGKGGDSVSYNKIAAAKGFIPNFSRAPDLSSTATKTSSAAIPFFTTKLLNEVETAMAAEQAAGVPSSRVRLGYDGRIPGGVGVYDAAQGSLSSAIGQHGGIDSALSDSAASRELLAAEGEVPNFVMDVEGVRSRHWSDNSPRQAQAMQLLDRELRKLIHAVSAGTLSEKEASATAKQLSKDFRLTSSSSRDVNKSFRNSAKEVESSKFQQKYGTMMGFGAFMLPMLTGYLPDVQSGTAGAATVGGLKGVGQGAGIGALLASGGDKTMMKVGAGITVISGILGAFEGFRKDATELKTELDKVTSANATAVTGLTKYTQMQTELNNAFTSGDIKNQLKITKALKKQFRDIEDASVRMEIVQAGGDLDKLNEALERLRENADAAKKSIDIIVSSASAQEKGRIFGGAVPVQGMQQILNAANPLSDDFFGDMGKDEQKLALAEQIKLLGSIKDLNAKQIDHLSTFIADDDVTKALFMLGVPLDQIPQILKTFKGDDIRSLVSGATDIQIERSRDAEALGLTSQVSESFEKMRKSVLEASDAFEEAAKRIVKSYSSLSSIEGEIMESAQPFDSIIGAKAPTDRRTELFEFKRERTLTEGLLKMQEATKAGLADLVKNQGSTNKALTEEIAKMMIDVTDEYQRTDTVTPLSAINLQKQILDRLGKLVDSGDLQEKDLEGITKKLQDINITSALQLASLRNQEKLAARTEAGSQLKNALEPLNNDFLASLDNLFAFIKPPVGIPTATSRDQTATWIMDVKAQMDKLGADMDPELAMQGVEGRLEYNLARLMQGAGLLKSDPMKGGMSLPWATGTMSPADAFDKAFKFDTAAASSLVPQIGPGTTAKDFADMIDLSPKDEKQHRQDMKDALTVEIKQMPGFETTYKADGSVDVKGLDPKAQKTLLALAHSLQKAAITAKREEAVSSYVSPGGASGQQIRSAVEMRRALQDVNLPTELKKQFAQLFDDSGEFQGGAAMKFAQLLEKSGYGQLGMLTGILDINASLVEANQHLKNIEDKIGENLGGMRLRGELHGQEQETAHLAKILMEILNKDRESTVQKVMDLTSGEGVDLGGAVRGRVTGGEQVFGNNVTNEQEERILSSFETMLTGRDAGDPLPLELSADALDNIDFANLGVIEGEDGKPLSKQELYDIYLRALTTSGFTAPEQDQPGGLGNLRSDVGTGIFSDVTPTLLNYAMSQHGGPGALGQKVGEDLSKERARMQDYDALNKLSPAAQGMQARYIAKAFGEGGASSEILASLNAKLDKLTNLGQGATPEATFLRDQKTALFEGLANFLTFQNQPGSKEYKGALDALDKLQEAAIKAANALVDSTPAPAVTTPALGFVPSLAVEADPQLLSRSLLTEGALSSSRSKVGFDSRLIPISGGVGVFNEGQGSLANAIGQHGALGQSPRQAANISRASQNMIQGPLSGRGGVPNLELWNLGDGDEFTAPKKLFGHTSVTGGDGVWLEEARSGDFIAYRPKMDVAKGTVIKRGDVLNWIPSTKRKGESLLDITSGKVDSSKKMPVGGPEKEKEEFPPGWIDTDNDGIHDQYDITLEEYKTRVQDNPDDMGYFEKFWNSMKESPEGMMMLTVLGPVAAWQVYKQGPKAWRALVRSVTKNPYKEGLKKVEYEVPNRLADGSIGTPPTIPKEVDANAYLEKGGIDKLTALPVEEQKTLVEAMQKNLDATEARLQNDGGAPKTDLHAPQQAALEKALGPVKNAAGLDEAEARMTPGTETTPLGKGDIEAVLDEREKRATDLQTADAAANKLREDLREYGSRVVTHRDADGKMTTSIVPDFPDERLARIKTFLNAEGDPRMSLTDAEYALGRSIDIQGPDFAAGGAYPGLDYIEQRFEADFINASSAQQQAALKQLEALEGQIGSAQDLGAVTKTLGVSELDYAKQYQLPATMYDAAGKEVSRSMPKIGSLQRVITDLKAQDANLKDPNLKWRRNPKFARGFIPHFADFIPNFAKNLSGFVPNLVSTAKLAEGSTHLGEGASGIVAGTSQRGHMPPLAIKSYDLSHYGHGSQGFDPVLGSPMDATEFQKKYPDVPPPPKAVAWDGKSADPLAMGKGATFSAADLKSYKKVLAATEFQSMSEVAQYMDTLPPDERINVNRPLGGIERTLKEGKLITPSLADSHELLKNLKIDSWAESEPWKAGFSSDRGQVLDLVKANINARAQAAGLIDPFMVKKGAQSYDMHAGNLMVEKEAWAEAVKEIETGHGPIDHKKIAEDLTSKTTVIDADFSLTADQRAHPQLAKARQQRKVLEEWLVKNSGLTPQVVNPEKGFQPSSFEEGGTSMFKPPGRGTGNKPGAGYMAIRKLSGYLDTGNMSADMLYKIWGIGASPEVRSRGVEDMKRWTQNLAEWDAARQNQWPNPLHQEKVVITSADVAGAQGPEMLRERMRMPSFENVDHMPEKWGRVVPVSELSAERLQGIPLTPQEPVKRPALEKLRALGLVPNFNNDVLQLYDIDQDGKLSPMEQDAAIDKGASMADLMRLGPGVVMSRELPHSPSTDPRFNSAGSEPTGPQAAAAEAQAQLAAIQAKNAKAAELDQLQDQEAEWRAVEQARKAQELVEVERAASIHKRTREDDRALQEEVSSWILRLDREKRSARGELAPGQKANLRSQGLPIPVGQRGHQYATDPAGHGSDFVSSLKPDLPDAYRGGVMDAKRTERYEARAKVVEQEEKKKQLAIQAMGNKLFLELGTKWPEGKGLLYPGAQGSVTRSSPNMSVSDSDVSKTWVPIPYPMRYLAPEIAAVTNEEGLLQDIGVRGSPGMTEDLTASVYQGAPLDATPSVQLHSVGQDVSGPDARSLTGASANQYPAMGKFTPAPDPLKGKFEGYNSDAASDAFLNKRGDVAWREQVSGNPSLSGGSYDRSADPRLGTGDEGGYLIPYTEGDYQGSKNYNLVGYKAPPEVMDIIRDWLPSLSAEEQDYIRSAGYKDLSSAEKSKLNQGRGPAEDSIGNKYTIEKAGVSEYGAMTGLPISGAVTGREQAFVPPELADISDEGTSRSRRLDRSALDARNLPQAKLGAETALAKVNEQLKAEQDPGFGIDAYQWLSFTNKADADAARRALKVARGRGGGESTLGNLPQLQKQIHQLGLLDVFSRGTPERPADRSVTWTPDTRSTSKVRVGDSDYQNRMDDFLEESPSGKSSLLNPLPLPQAYGRTDSEYDRQRAMEEEYLHGKNGIDPWMLTTLGDPGITGKSEIEARNAELRGGSTTGPNLEFSLASELKGGIGKGRLKLSDPQNWLGFSLPADNQHDRGGDYRKKVWKKYQEVQGQFYSTFPRPGTEGLKNRAQQTVSSYESTLGRNPEITMTQSHPAPLQLDDPVTYEEASNMQGGTGFGTNEGGAPFREDKFWVPNPFRNPELVDQYEALKLQKVYLENFLQQEAFTERAAEAELGNISETPRTTIHNITRGKRDKDNAFTENSAQTAAFLLSLVGTGGGAAIGRGGMALRTATAARWSTLRSAGWSGAASTIKTGLRGTPAASAKWMGKKMSDFYRFTLPDIATMGLYGQGRAGLMKAGVGLQTPGVLGTALRGGIGYERGATAAATWGQFAKTSGMSLGTGALFDVFLPVYLNKMRLEEEGLGEGTWSEAARPYFDENGIPKLGRLFDESLNAVGFLSTPMAMWGQVGNILGFGAQELGLTTPEEGAFDLQDITSALYDVGDMTSFASMNRGAASLFLNPAENAEYEKIKKEQGEQAAKEYLDTKGAGLFRPGGALNENLFMEAFSPLTISKAIEGAGQSPVDASTELPALLGEGTLKDMSTGTGMNPQWVNQINENMSQVLNVPRSADFDEKRRLSPGFNQAWLMQKEMAEVGGYSTQYLSDLYQAIQSAESISESSGIGLGEDATRKLAKNVGKISDLTGGRAWDEILTQGITSEVTDLDTQETGYSMLPNYPYSVPVYNAEKLQGDAGKAWERASLMHAGLQKGDPNYSASALGQNYIWEGGAAPGNMQDPDHAIAFRQWWLSGKPEPVSRDAEGIEDRIWKDSHSKWGDKAGEFSTFNFQNRTPIDLATYQSGSVDAFTQSREGFANSLKEDVMKQASGASLMKRLKYLKNLETDQGQVNLLAQWRSLSEDEKAQYQNRFSVFVNKRTQELGVSSRPPELKAPRSQRSKSDLWRLNRLQDGEKTPMIPRTGENKARGLIPNLALAFGAHNLMTGLDSIPNLQTYKPLDGVLDGYLASLPGAQGETPDVLLRESLGGDKQAYHEHLRKSTALDPNYSDEHIESLERRGSAYATKEAARLRELGSNPIDRQTADNGGRFHETYTADEYRAAQQLEAKFDNVYNQAAYKSVLMEAAFRGEFDPTKSEHFVGMRTPGAGGGIGQSYHKEGDKASAGLETYYRDKFKLPHESRTAGSMAGAFEADTRLPQLAEEWLRTNGDQYVNEKSAIQGLMGHLDRSGVVRPSKDALESLRPAPMERFKPLLPPLLPLSPQRPVPPPVSLEGPRAGRSSLEKIKLAGGFVPNFETNIWGEEVKKRSSEVAREERLKMIRLERERIRSEIENKKRRALAANPELLAAQETRSRARTQLARDQQDKVAENERAKMQYYWKEYRTQYGSGNEQAIKSKMKQMNPPDAFSTGTHQWHTPPAGSDLISDPRWSRLQRDLADVASPEWENVSSGGKKRFRGWLSGSGGREELHFRAQHRKFKEGEIPTVPLKHDLPSSARNRMPEFFRDKADRSGGLTRPGAFSGAGNRAERERLDARQAQISSLFVSRTRFGGFGGDQKKSSQLNMQEAAIDYLDPVQGLIGKYKGSSTFLSSRRAGGSVEPTTYLTETGAQAQANRQEVGLGISDARRRWLTLEDSNLMNQLTGPLHSSQRDRSDSNVGEWDARREQAINQGWTLLRSEFGGEDRFKGLRSRRPELINKAEGFVPNFGLGFSDSELKDIKEKREKADLRQQWGRDVAHYIETGEFRGLLTERKLTNEMYEAREKKVKRWQPYWKAATARLPELFQTQRYQDLGYWDAGGQLGLQNPKIQNEFMQYAKSGGLRQELSKRGRLPGSRTPEQQRSFDLKNQEAQRQSVAGSKVVRKYRDGQDHLSVYMRRKGYISGKDPKEYYALERLARATVNNQGQIESFPANMPANFDNLQPRMQERYVDYLFNNQGAGFKAVDELTEASLERERGREQQGELNSKMRMFDIWANAGATQNITDLYPPEEWKNDPLGPYDVDGFLHDDHRMRLAETERMDEMDQWKGENPGRHLNYLQASDPLKDLFNHYLDRSGPYFLHEGQGGQMSGSAVLQQKQQDMLSRLGPQMDGGAPWNNQGDKGKFDLKVDTWDELSRAEYMITNGRFGEGQALSMPSEHSYFDKLTDQLKDNTPEVGSPDRLRNLLSMTTYMEHWFKTRGYPLDTSDVENLFESGHHVQRSMIGLGPRVAPLASGLIPNFNLKGGVSRLAGGLGPAAAQEVSLARVKGGYNPGKVTHMKLPGESQVFMGNLRETASVVNTPKGPKTFVNPPGSSPAGIRHAALSKQKTGINPYNLPQQPLTNFAGTGSVPKGVHKSDAGSPRLQADFSTFKASIGDLDKALVGFGTSVDKLVQKGIHNIFEAQVSVKGASDLQNQIKQAIQESVGAEMTAWLAANMPGIIKRAQGGLFGPETP